METTSSPGGRMFLTAFLDFPVMIEEITKITASLISQPVTKEFGGPQIGRIVDARSMINPGTGKQSIEIKVQLNDHGKQLFNKQEFKGSVAGFTLKRGG
jgi:hypothetical protein